jgi:hypothetical protein
VAIDDVGDGYYEPAREGDGEEESHHGSIVLGARKSVRSTALICRDAGVTVDASVQPYVRYWPHICALACWA